MQRSFCAFACAALALTALTGASARAGHTTKKPAHAATGKTVTTKSGLKYEDIVVGKGPMPRAGQTVLVQYVGTFPDGRKFDASSDHGSAPFAFTLGAGQVIQGWDEGLSTMRVGGKRKLIVPYTLGYGPQGQPPVIPPKATLLFTVELVGIR
jgi:peptidylprolyl isomerase